MPQSIKAGCGQCDSFCKLQQIFGCLTFFCHKMWNSYSKKTLGNLKPKYDTVCFNTSFELSFSLSLRQILFSCVKLKTISLCFCSYFPAILDFYNQHPKTSNYAKLIKKSQNERHKHNTNNTASHTSHCKQRQTQKKEKKDIK